MKSVYLRVDCRSYGRKRVRGLSGVGTDITSMESILISGGERSQDNMPHDFVATIRAISCSISIIISLSCFEYLRKKTNAFPWIDEKCKFAKRMQM